MRRGVLVALSVLLVFSCVVFWIVWESLYGVENVLAEYRDKDIYDVVFFGEEHLSTLDAMKYANEYNCSAIVNSTHAVYVCHALWQWDKIVFSDYSTLTIHDVTRFRGRIPYYINFTYTEVADLKHRIAWVVEEAGTEALGLKHYKRILRYEPFTYKWVDLTEHIYRLHASWRVSYVEDRGVVITLAFFTYKDVGDEKVQYMPMPEEDVKYYLKYAKLYCEVIRNWLGVKCEVETVDPHKYCKWPKTPIRASKGPDITCASIGKRDIIAVVEVPTSLKLGRWGGVIGINTNGGRLILFYGGGILFLHELGHSLKLVDVDALDYYKVPPWVKQIFYESVMGNLKLPDVDTFKITLGDIVIILTNTYNRLLKHTSQATTIHQKLLEYGINPEKETILLPITKDNSLPPGIKPIIMNGYIEINPSPPINSPVKEEIIINPALPKLLQTITTIAQNSTKH